MTDLKKIVAEVEKKVAVALEQISSLDECNTFRTTFLGKKGLITELNDKLKVETLKIKKELGPLVQTLRHNTENTLNAKIDYFNNVQKEALLKKSSSFDVTIQNDLLPNGSVHLLALVATELEDIFISMGFALAKGPEVETDFYNFTALNIDQHHPARDAHDTFWLAGYQNLLLRTHTSNAQIHTMLANKPPLAVASTGRVFRNEATDASHDFMFMQVEALLVDKNVSIANLLYTTKAMLQAFFETKTLDIRVRPGYFPFVEPGLEVDASCPFCTHGCSVCKNSGWIELGGAGLVHPHVLKACNIDSSTYNGFALGFGVSRLALLKYGIPDVRLLYSNKIEILSQFNRLKF
jgi:phenylalanyl-tRNA synthetase alpha chain